MAGTSDLLKACSIAVWAWCGLAVATRIDVFGVHVWGGHGGVFDLAASPIEMSIWFSPIAVVRVLNDRQKARSSHEKNGSVGESSWDMPFAIVIWGFLGLFTGLAALIPPVLFAAVVFGEEAASALFGFVLAID